jgi:hypothetical protein
MLHLAYDCRSILLPGLVPWSLAVRTSERNQS